MDWWSVPIPSGTFIGNISGVAALPYPVSISQLPFYTVPLLAQFVALVDRPSFVVLLGTLVRNDGNGGFFVWMAGDTTPADNFNVIECSPSGEAGRYLRFNFSITLG